MDIWDIRNAGDIRDITAATVAAVGIDDAATSPVLAWSSDKVSGEISDLSAQKADKAQEAWITPTLVNGWLPWSADLAPGYYKDTIGIVHLRGVAKSGTGPAFVLPVGYRPAKNKYFTACGDESFVLVNIPASGSVLFTIGANSNFNSFDGITFLV